MARSLSSIDLPPRQHPNGSGASIEVDAGLKGAHLIIISSLNPIQLGAISFVGAQFKPVSTPRPMKSGFDLGPPDLR